jgi:two-component system, NtrC family, sensor histidine kinase HydH
VVSVVLPSASFITDGAGARGGKGTGKGTGIRVAWVEMGSLDWVYLFGAVGQASLAGLCLVRGKRSPMAWPLALLCLSVFGWCFSTLAFDLTGQAAWGILDSCATALSPPCAVHLTATFVGARRARARTLALFWVYFSAIALATAGALFVPALRRWTESPSWAAAYLVGWGPAFVFLLALLVRHVTGSVDPDEKARGRLMLAAAVLLAVLGTNDIVRELGFATPRLAPLGALASALLMATAVFRFRMFDRDLSVNAPLYTIAMALAGLVAYLVVIRALGSNVAATAFGMAAVTACLGVAVHEAATSSARERARLERLVALGRFSGQMAHDLKNPLASLKGALQFLEEEHRLGHSLDAHHDFLRLMLDQVERLGRLADDYQRVGRVEPVCRPVDVNEVVRSVVALEPFAAASAVSIRTDLAPSLPACAIDTDLFARALENLVRNAFEAMPKGGTLTVRTARGEGDGGRVVISVADEGQGMDARQAERAFDEFYTTKATGSGLGLAFVRRVAEAHGGRASLESRRGEGTVVEMQFPAAS